MKKYKNTEPVFSEEIDIYEDTDPVDAETVDNVPLKQLHDNDLILLANVKAVYAFADQILACAFLTHQRLAGITTFSYDEQSGTVINFVGCVYDKGTIYLPEDKASYREDGTIILTSMEDFDFGAKGFLFSSAANLIISPPGSSESGGVITLPENLAKILDGETIQLEPGISIPDIPGGGTGGGGSPYVLPVATQTRLGGVKIGSGIISETDGTIRVNAESTAEAAADIVERNATEPSDEDIDRLFT